MQKKITLRLKPEDASNEDRISKSIANHLGVKPTSITGYQVQKKSIDARGKQIVYNLSVNAFVDEPFHQQFTPAFHFKPVGKSSTSVVIIGAGPAGIFAALKLIEQGIKPIILERGKDVKSRRRDLAALNKQGVINPESNYCFGEGGAGSYSDGKLYTRSLKRGDVRRIFENLVYV